MADWPKKVSDWEGCTCRLLVDMDNALATIPAGTVMTVESVSGAVMRMVSAPCGCCGVGLRLAIKGSRACKIKNLEFLSLSADS